MPAKAFGSGAGVGGVGRLGSRGRGSVAPACDIFYPPFQAWTADMDEHRCTPMILLVWVRVDPLWLLGLPWGKGTNSSYFEETSKQLKLSRRMRGSPHRCHCIAVWKFSEDWAVNLICWDSQFNLNYYSESSIIEFKTAYVGLCGGHPSWHQPNQDPFSSSCIAVSSALRPCLRKAFVFFGLFSFEVSSTEINWVHFWVMQLRL